MSARFLKYETTLTEKKRNKNHDVQANLNTFYPKINLLTTIYGEFESS